ncbi:MAG: hypothetical protein V3V88_03550 [Dehalococcoidia bacterium]
MDKDKVILCKETFDTDSGKKFLDVLSVMCKENKPTYVAGNPGHSAYQEGQRSIILGIRNMLAKDLGKEINRKAVR